MHSLFFNYFYKSNSMWKTLLSLVSLCTLIFLLFSCSEENPEDFEVNPEFKKYISSFTSGVISSVSTIKIEVVKPYAKKVKPNQPIDKEIFSISPEIEGKTVWIDQYTIQFIPTHPMHSGETYWIEFALDKIKQVPEELKIFKFPITIIDQAINFEEGGLRSYSTESIDWYEFSGKVIAADAITKKALDKNISVTVNGVDKKTKCRAFQPGGRHGRRTGKKQGSGRIYKLIVDSVQRRKKAGEITITWNYRNNCHWTYFI